MLELQVPLLHVGCGVMRQPTGQAHILRMREAHRQCQLAGESRGRDSGDVRGSVGIHCRQSAQGQERASAGGKITAVSQRILVAVGRAASKGGILRQLLVDAFAVDEVEDSVPAAEHALSIAAQVIGEADARGKVVGGIG